MSRSSNDDRSDSMNPNNDAYCASEQNRMSQMGASDDDDSNNSVNVVPVRAHFFESQSFLGLRDNSKGNGDDIVLGTHIAMEKRLEMLEGIRITCVNEKQVERTAKVETYHIDIAVTEAKKLWETGNLVFLCLYDQEKVLFERSSISDYADEDITLLNELEKIDRLLKKALIGHKSARASLMAVSEFDRGGVERELPQLGVWRSTVQDLEEYQADVMLKLEKNGVDAKGVSLIPAILASKNCAKVKICSEWIKQFHLGKVKHDQLHDVLTSPIKIEQMTKRMNES
ncbi:hypothetical protein [Undibacterium flavidum]|uniref:Uncharacterized protein n=1 Tax=Undibacterium flavidum TaxID=2762297 RepID=A0ABR6Y9A1_9BURK|nr:hypothetical protein [Undibacterium flavidum]MBC3873206.1 hypothetical protein [Undibacterium flavidum]